MITYDWNCKIVDVHPQEAGETDVVYNVHWIVTGISNEIDSEGNAYQATAIGTKTLLLDSESEFIPFEDLTNETVVGWTKDAMGAEQVTSIEAGIQQAIDLKINPTSVTMTIGD
tara:strand:- start:541 stop:882 length:342 start_codon:yes stop_codon:yes gene_type:complete